eukprot:COSAG02_NODE_14332_length_1283_cov_1.447635_4_plen_60_part_00
MEYSQRLCLRPSSKCLRKQVLAHLTSSVLPRLEDNDDDGDSEEAIGTDPNIPGPSETDP